MFIILFPIAMRQIVIFAENSEKLQRKVAPFYEDKNQTEAVKEIIQKLMLPMATQVLDI